MEKRLYRGRGLWISVPVPFFSVAAMNFMEGEVSLWYAVFVFLALSSYVARMMLWSSVYGLILISHLLLMFSSTVECLHAQGVLVGSA